MVKTRVAMEFGMGASLRQADYTKAAMRAVSDALWHNSLNMAEAFGFAREDMIVDIEIGVQQPEKIDKAAVKAVLPYGKGTVSIVHGGGAWGGWILPSQMAPEPQSSPMPQLPRGNPLVKVVAGGLDVIDWDNDTVCVIATAAIEAYLAINPAEWRISPYTQLLALPLCTRSEMA